MTKRPCVASWDENGSIYYIPRFRQHFLFLCLAISNTQSTSVYLNQESIVTGMFYVLLIVNHCEGFGVNVKSYSIFTFAETVCYYTMT